MVNFDNISKLNQAVHDALAEYPSACKRCGSTKLNLLGRCICGGFVGPVPRCPGCNDPIPPQDIRCQDSDGHDVCLTCGDGQPCPECHGLRGDRAGICRTCNGSGAQEPDNDDPEVLSYV